MQNMYKHTESANLLIKTAFNREQYIQPLVITGTNDGNHISINLGTIIDRLIHDVGRYCETHCNDFLITWERVKEALANTTQGVDYIAFGIRQLGVDSNDFIYSRVANHPHEPGWASLYYRKIYALRIWRKLQTQYPDDVMEITVTLKDITDSIRNSDIRILNNESDSAGIQRTDNNIEPRVQWMNELHTAYEKYDRNEAFQPTDEAARRMNCYLQMHCQAPDINSIKSFETKLAAYRVIESEWTNQNEKNWSDYCASQIGLAAAILLLKTEERP